ncbi:MAG: hypothetical protein AAFW74_06505 [Pseudomonadota bacterium]
MMDMLQSLFKSGAIIDLILLLMAVEVILLLVWRHFTGAGVAPRALLPFLAAGGCLMMAVKFALTGQDWTHVAIALGGAFVFHLTDVTYRWKGTARNRVEEKQFQTPEL